MENTVYSTAMPNNNSENMEVSCELHEYYGCDIKIVLEKLKEELEELVIEVTVEAKNDTAQSSNATFPNITLKLKDVVSNTISENLDETKMQGTSKSSERNEQIHKILDRIEKLQTAYDGLLKKLSFVIFNLKQLYKESEYVISITEIITTIEVQQNDDILPKVESKSSTKRKLNFSLVESKEEENQSEYPIPLDEYPELLVIGPNGTTVSRKNYADLQLKCAAGATRGLCSIIFGDEILATHSLTGNQSPAFRGRERPAKKQLDPLKIADITHLICSKFKVNQQLVRSTITTKCADASKKQKRLSAKAMK